jgi:hypothetical protein
MRNLYLVLIVGRLKSFCMISLWIGLCCLLFVVVIWIDLFVLLCLVVDILRMS